MFKKYRHLLFLFLCLILVFSVGTKVYAAETITEERPAETTVESSTVDGTTAEEPTTEEATVAYDNEETIPDEEPEAVGDETLVETTSAEETTAEEPTTEEATVAYDNEEAIPTNETEVTSEEETAEESEETISTEEPEAVAEEALATELIPEETQVETATATKSEKRLIEEHPEQTEETVPKVGLRGGSRPPGWSQDEDGNWYYYNADGTPYNGWLRYNGYWYYIKNGFMCTVPTWVGDDDNGYYWRLNANGQLEEKSGWVSWFLFWFYFDSNGRGYDGWLSYNGYWYYIHRGRMLTGRTEIYDKETDEYDYWRFGDEGRLITKTEWYQDDDNWFYSIGGKDHLGWLRLNKKWYFIAADDGMYSDKKSVEGILYNFGTDGALIEQGGWVKDGSTWYYLDQDGSYHDGWLSYKGHWYYIDYDGSMCTGPTRADNDVYWRLNANGQLEAKAGWFEDKDRGKWYYFDSNGKGYNGWLPYNGKWYYINKGRMCTGPTYVSEDGYYWRFKDSGELEAIAGWVEDKVWNNWYYFNSNGKGYDGWLRYNNNYYYISGGYMCSGPRSRDKDGYYWRFKYSGQLEAKAGWFQDIYGSWFYFDSAGKGYDGWLRYNNKWYYFDKGYMLNDGYDNASGKLCKFAENGAYIETAKGWVKDDDDYYYYANQDGTIPAGWLKYNNKWYYIYEDGRMAEYSVLFDGKIYIFDSSGALASGWFKYDGRYPCYANSDGTAYYGWLQRGSQWYYNNLWGWTEIHACRIDGKAHKFDRYGVWLSEQ